MDFDQLKQWMDLIQKYQSNDFWGNIFNQPAFKQFMKENLTTEQMGPSQNQTHPDPRSQTKSNSPALDMYMTEKEVIIIVDLPGYSKENIVISVSGDRLLLKGKLEPFTTGHPIMQERNPPSFERIVQLPEPTNSEDIQAKLQNGLLTIMYDRRYVEAERIIID